MENLTIIKAATISQEDKSRNQFFLGFVESYPERREEGDPSDIEFSGILHLTYNVGPELGWKVINAPASWLVTEFRKANKWEKIFLLKVGITIGLEERVLNLIRKEIYEER